MAFSCDPTGLSSHCPGSPSTAWHCHGDPTPARWMVTPRPLANVLSLLNRAVLFHRNSGKTSETIRQNGETAQAHQAIKNKFKKPKTTQQNIQPTSQKNPKVLLSTHPTESIGAWDYFTQFSPSTQDKCSPTGVSADALLEVHVEYCVFGTQILLFWI